MALGDLNGDGRPDIVVANYNANDVVVMLNTTTPGPASGGRRHGLVRLWSDLLHGNWPQRVGTGGRQRGRPARSSLSNFKSNNVSVLLSTTTPGPASGGGAVTPSFASQVTFRRGWGLSSRP